MQRILLATAYFPPAAYLSACLNAEEIVIEACETYQKQTCRNHCRIYGPNGIQTLTVPVTKPNGNHTLTRDIRIPDGIPWQRIHWRSITAAYNKSPYLLYYQDYFYPFFEDRYDFLLDLNLEILNRVRELLNMKVRIEMTEHYQKSPEGMTDLRNALVSKHGMRDVFPEYVQPFSDRSGFIGGLSCLDLFVNLGPDTGSYLQMLGVSGIS